MMKVEVIGMRQCKCGHNNPSDAVFCMNCGSRLIESPSASITGTTCPDCGCTIGDPDAVFCYGCGKRLRAESQYDSGYQQSGYRTPLKVIKAEKHLGDKNIGIPEARGSLTIYEDALEFGKKSVIETVGASNQISKETEIFSIKEIANCYSSQFAFLVTALVIEFRSGEVIKFVGYTKTKEILDCVRIINAQMKSIDIEEKINDPIEDYNRFRFVMPINNIAVVNDRSIAVVGSVLKGSVTTGDMLSIINQDDENKGTFEVRSVAVNKRIAQSASVGDTDTALLIFCPPSYVKHGDKACVLL